MIDLLAACSTAFGITDFAACPRSWRRHFATPLQGCKANPLIRQQTLGHRPTNSSGLSMTVTHTRAETQRRQIEQALRRWPASLRYAAERVSGRPV